MKRFQLGGNIQNIGGFRFDSNLIIPTNNPMIYIATDTVTGNQMEVVRRLDGSYHFFTTPSGNVTKSQMKSKPILEKQVGGIAELGYKRNSPYNYLPQITIPSNKITMQDVDHPIMAYPNGDSAQLMLPNKDYYFPNSTKVKEVPIKNINDIKTIKSMKNMKNMKYQNGGQMDVAMQMLQQYFQMMKLTEEQINQFLQEFQSMSPQEQQEVLSYIQQELQNSQSDQAGQSNMQPTQMSEEQLPMQEQMMAQMGFEVPNSYNYGRGTLDSYMCGGTKYQTAGIVGKMNYEPNYINDFSNTPIQLQKAPLIIEPVPTTPTVRGNEIHTVQYAEPVDLSAYIKTSPQQVSKQVATQRKDAAKIRNKVLNQGEDVKKIQQFLVDNGFSLPKYGVDGKLGNETTKALVDYAKSNNLGTDFGAVSEVFAHILKQSKGTSKPSTTYEQVSQTSPKVEEKANKELYSWMGSNNDYPKVGRLSKDKVKYESYADVPLTVKSVSKESTSIDRKFPLNNSSKTKKLWDYVPGDDRAFMGYDVVNISNNLYTLKGPGNKFYSYDSNNGKLLEIKGTNFIYQK